MEVVPLRIESLMLGLLVEDIILRFTSHGFCGGLSMKVVGQLRYLE